MIESKPSRSLDPLFSPRSVAVVGASRRCDSIGFGIVDNLLKNHFQGIIYPVNPSAPSVHSLKCYPSLIDIPDEVDLVIIVVPRDMVEGVIDDCVAKGVGGVVVITAGFGETGDDGREIEDRIVKKVRDAGIRMVGPNCMGIINTDDEIGLNATFAPTPARRGAIGFVSQSGALGVAILNVASGLGLGLTQFASLGNKVDVSGNDLLEYWENDPQTKVIAMYLESLGNPRHFTELAKRIGRKKPILIVKSGRTQEGARAASSHTGSLAGADITVSTFFNHCGVVRAETIEELFDLARALEHCPISSGNRVAIITNAGGPAIMATDSCVNLGLQIPTLSDQTQSQLEPFLPPEASLTNPVDMIASAGAEQFEKTTRIVLSDDDVDMGLAIFVTPMLARPMDVLEAISRGAQGIDKPLLSVIMAEEAFYDEIKTRSDLPPVYRFPEAAARSLAMVYRYSAWRRRPQDEEIPVFETNDGEVTELLAKTGQGYLPTEDAFRVLELYGIPVARWKVARDWEEVRRAAQEIGYPVVLKGDSPDLVHKSDLGGVRLGIGDAQTLEEAFFLMKSRLTEGGYPPRGYLIQEAVKGGQEVVFGISSDPRFGPLIMFGRGGKYVEVFQDVTFGVTPLSPMEAREMIERTKGYKLLQGFRGEASADLEMIEEVLLRLAQLAARHPSIVELDINPFAAGANRNTSKALDIRIKVE